MRGEGSTNLLRSLCHAERTCFARCTERNALRTKGETAFNRQGQDRRRLLLLRGLVVFCSAERPLALPSERQNPEVSRRHSVQARLVTQSKSQNGQYRQVTKPEMPVDSPHSSIPCSSVEVAKLSPPGNSSNPTILSAVRVSKGQDKN